MEEIIISIIKIKDFYTRNRIFIILITLIIGTICTMFVDFGNPEINKNWYNALYHTFQFFLLNAALPVDGAWYVFYPLILIYFLVPIVTIDFISSIFNNIFNIITLPEKKYLKLKNHIVIAGLGKSGEFLSRQFASNIQNKNEYILVIDNNDQLIRKNIFLDRRIKYLLDDISRIAVESDNLNVIEDKSISKIVTDEKDIFAKPFNNNKIIKTRYNNSFIVKANIKNARLFITLTGNDFANLDAAFLLKNEQNKPHCFIQISDPQLLRAIREQQSKYFDPDVDKIHIINSYEIVAKRVVVDLIARKKDTINEKENLFVIAGFGNFGKMIFEQIIKQHKNIKPEIYSICIIDTKSDIDDDVYFSSIALNVLSPGYKNATSDSNCQVNYLISDIRKRETWEGVFNANVDKSVIIIIATDNDTNNLSAAIRIQNIMEKQSQEINIVCRFFRNPLVLLGNPNVTACTFSDIFHEELIKMINPYIM